MCSKRILSLNSFNSSTFMNSEYQKNKTIKRAGKRSVTWLMGKKPEEKRSFRFQTVFENKESIGAGIIAGGSIVGIALMIIETVF